MTMSDLALKAKRVIDAAWLHGPAYDLSSQAAFALEAVCMLQSPETAAERQTAADAVELLARAVAELKREHEESARLRAELTVSEQSSERRRIAWRMAYQRAQGRGWAADRAGEHARQGQTALQDMLASLLAVQIERDAALARIAELESERHVTNEALDDAAKALREQRDRIAELEQAAFCQSVALVNGARCHLPVRHRGDHRTEDKRQYWSDEFAAPASGRAERSAEKLRALLAEQREDDPFHLRHNCRMSRDLPEPGGERRG